MTFLADPEDLTSILKDKAERQPDSVALLAPGRPPLDYAALYQQVGRCSAWLAAAGLERNSRIGVVLPNGPEMASCCLGVAAYATCAPLNPGYQQDEFRFYLKDVQADALILAEGADSPARAAARELGLEVLELRVSADAPAGYIRFSTARDLSDIAPATASPGGVALILHTSGTTSRPKIVPLTHANLCASALNIVETVHLGPDDRCLNVMPLFHIHGFVAALLATLAGGGSLVCAPGFDGGGFFGWVGEFQPTWYTAVPTIHQAVVQIGDRYREQAPGHRFRFVRSSSAALPPASLAALEELFAVPVIEAYGMTEAAHQMASNPLPPEERKPGSVGLPAGPEVAVMDAGGNLLNDGQTGEVVIRGKNVTPGYENNPAANAGAFTSGWFRTGDQGRIDRDGYLFLTGRLKEIINRGGEKVSPREVDETLLEHPAVEQAVAFSVPHPSLGEDLAAAVVLKRGAVASANELRDFAFRHMADHKVPSKMIVLDGIPKTATGKIQRLALAEKLADHLEDSYLAPETDTERLLAEAIGEVLGLSEVGIRNNFFALGGDSLRATRVIGRLNAELDLALPAPSLFHHPTIEELATRVDAALVERDERLEQMVAEIESLSDEEVERLLKES